MFPSFQCRKIYPDARFTFPAMGGAEVKEMMEWYPDIIHTDFEFSTFALAQQFADSTYPDLPIPRVRSMKIIAFTFRPIARSEK